MKLKPEEVFMYDLLFKEYKITSLNILGIYLFGSRLYGTNHEHSDYDYIVIVKDDEPYRYYESKFLDIHIYNEAEYEKELSSFRMGVVECALQTVCRSENIKPIKSYIGNVEFGYDLDLWKVRKGISQVVHNSYDKAKKKIIKADEVYIGAKSLSHSIRLIDYGIQLATVFKHNFHFDFERCNHTHEQIMLMTNQFIDDPEWFLGYTLGEYDDTTTELQQRELFWKILENKYRFSHNENVKMFRILCPKPEGESDER